MKTPGFSLTGYQIKYIALSSMFLDHLGLVFYSDLSVSTYYLLRGIGRIAFPLFCFFLAEGFYYTRSRRKYLARLLLFCLLSEIPFDMAIHKSLTDSIPGLLSPLSQNVFFTLTIGFILMMYLDRSAARSLPGLLLPAAAACILAEALSTDYGAAGVCTIFLFYLRKTGYFRADPEITLPLCLVPLLVLSVSSPIELACLFSLLPLRLYHQERGTGPKYLFYVFYPAHLLLLVQLKSGL